VSSSHLLVSNCGDSRAVLWDQADGGVDFALSLDHKPSRRAEKRRIEALGGRITYFGVPRVNGVLAVSRAIGDSAYKRFIISDPEQRSRKGACLPSIIADKPRTLPAKMPMPCTGLRLTCPEPAAVSLVGHTYLFVRGDKRTCDHLIAIPSPQ
jgi:serine/threonine protein phosphatase PrpC